MTALDLRATLINAAAKRLARTHWDGSGCGTNGTNGCSRCHGPSPATASEVADEVLDAVLPLLADAVAARWAEAYPSEVFTPITTDDAPHYHRAFTDAGLSIDRWSAHVMQYGYRGAAALLRSLTEGTGQ